MTKRYWAGFSDGKIHTTEEEGSRYKIYSIFTSKKEAKLAYEDVREVTIEEI